MSRKPFSTLGALTPLACFALISIGLGSTALAQDKEVAELRKGFVFVDGKLQPQPCSVARFRDSIEINGTTYEADYFDVGSNERFAGPRGGQNAGWRFRGPRGFGGKGPRGRSDEFSPSMNRLWSSLTSVSAGSILFLDKGQRPVGVWPSQGGDEMMLALKRHADDPNVSPTLPERYQSVVSDSQWQSVVATYHSDPDFRSKVNDRVGALTFADAEAQSISRAQRWVGMLAFPLVAFGCVIVVFAVGHLLMHAPFMVGDKSASFDHDQARAISIQTLGIVAVLSALDLIWTLVSHHNGSMTELNPLGSGIIDHPALLVLFKTMVTALSIGLLYTLRAKPLARKAMWWCCLVLTLLTARWITFQSMFV